MPAKKKLADLPKKALKARKAADIKGGRFRAQRLASGAASTTRKAPGGQHNQTLRTRA